MVSAQRVHIIHILLTARVSFYRLCTHRLASDSEGVFRHVHLGYHRSKRTSQHTFGTEEKLRGTHLIQLVGIINVLSSVQNASSGSVAMKMDHIESMIKLPLEVPKANPLIIFNGITSNPWVSEYTDSILSFGADCGGRSKSHKEIGSEIENSGLSYKCQIV